MSRSRTLASALTVRSPLLFLGSWFSGAVLALAIGILLATLDSDAASISGACLFLGGVALLYTRAAAASTSVDRGFVLGALFGTARSGTIRGSSVALALGAVVDALLLLGVGALCLAPFDADTVSARAWFGGQGVAAAFLCLLGMTTAASAIGALVGAAGVRFGRFGRGAAVAVLLAVASFTLVGSLQQGRGLQDLIDAATPVSTGLVLLLAAAVLAAASWLLVRRTPVR